MVNTHLIRPYFLEGRGGIGGVEFEAFVWRFGNVGSRIMKY